VCVCLVVVSRDSFSAPSQIIQTYRRAHSSLSLSLSLSLSHSASCQYRSAQKLYFCCVFAQTNWCRHAACCYLYSNSLSGCSSERAGENSIPSTLVIAHPPAHTTPALSLSLSLVLLSIFQTKSLAACKNAQGNTSNAERIYSSGGGSGVLSFSPSCSLARTLSLWLYTFLAPPSSATGRKSTTTTTTRSGTMLWLSARARERPFLLWHANQYAVNNYFPNAARIAGCLGDVFCCGCFRACKTKGEIADGILTSTVFEARFSGPLIRV